MKSLKTQAGFSLMSGLMIVTVVGFLLTCVFKMGPHYLDFLNVQNTLKNVASQYPNFNNLSDNEIKSIMDKYMAVNGIRGQESQKFKIQRKKGRVLISNKYAVQVPLFANVDVVMNFAAQLDSDNVSLCCSYKVDVDDPK